MATGKSISSSPSAPNHGGNVEVSRKTSGTYSQVSKFDLALMYLLPLFALTTLLQELPVLSYLNRAMAFVALILVMLALFKNGMSKWKYALLGVYLAVVVISAGLTHWTSQAIAEAPRGIFCISLLLYYHEKRSFVDSFCVEHIKYLHAVIAIWTVLVAISIPMKSSWASQWGGSTYFCSYVKSAFQLMPTALLVLALDLVMLKIEGKSVKALIYCIVPLFAGLQGGSRTYFILTLTMVLLILLNCRLTKFQILIIAALGLGIIGYQFASSGIGAKMLHTTSSQTMSYSGMDALGTLTSGRSEFWSYDIKAFFDLSFFQQFIGNGFSFSYTVNLETVGNSIFAHNDFINLLMESGYIGLFSYLVSICCVLKIARDKSKSGPIFFLILLIWLFNASINSFYPYTSAVISLVFTIASLSLGCASTNRNRTPLEATWHSTFESYEPVQ